MGLIDWIKGKYYDYRLNKADKLVLQKRFNDATDIYRSLFGRHCLAVPHLSNMYVTNSHSVEEKLSALKSISELKRYTDQQNVELYNKELNTHVSIIEKLSLQCFNNKNYHEAVLLLDAIVPFKKKGQQALIVRVNQNHAYLAFSKLQQTNQYSSFLDEMVNRLKAYESTCSNDINYFVESLKNQNYYSRAIKILLPFLQLDQKYKKQIIDFLVEIVLGKDKDYPKPTKLSDYCQDQKLCVEAANHIYQLSNKATGNKEYAKSVLFDYYAAEFLTSDNNFNVSRCYHKFKEIEQRADANEIKALLDFAKQLKLTDQQIDSIKSDIEKLAKSCEPLKGVNICRLFLSEKKFDIIYIEQAEKVAKSNPAAINSQELLGVITSNSDEDSFVDVIVPFVNHIPDFSEQFINSAIDKIIRHKSMPMFEKYWPVKEDAQFFNRLVSKESEIAEETVRFVASKYELFLHSNELMQAFISSIDNLNDNKFSYQSAEELYKNGCKVLRYFIDKTNTYCDNLSDDESVTIIDNTLNIIDYLHIYQSWWIPLYLRKRKIQEKRIKTQSQKTSFYKESIDTINNSSIDFKEIYEPSYFELWQEYTNLVLKRSESQPKEKAIDDLTNVRVLIDNYCKSYDEYTSLCKTLTNRIAKLRWETAKELEEYRDFENAMGQYEAAVCEGDTAYKTKADFRYLICAVKANKLTEDIEKKIKSALERKSYQSLKDDLAYRYACLLLKSTRPGDAEHIIKTFLPTESYLLDICRNIYIKESEKYLADFNSKFDSIAKDELSIDDAITFLRQFPKYKEIISRNLNDTTNKFIGYRRKLESYIVKSFFDEEKYNEALSMLFRIFPNFFEDDTNFRNVAIAALGIIESADENISEDTLKLSIAIWLSAIYNDRLFVKSLDYTSWDDPFTFTLDGSLGASIDDDYLDIPENINFDPAVDNQNIAIVDSQNSLISRVETIIRANIPQLEKFFNDEKDALDKLISLNLDEEIIVASPYFAKKFNRILDTIKDSMDNELVQGYGNEENVISLGVKYGFSGGDYARYNNALIHVEKCKSAYASSPATLQRELLYLSEIREFDDLYSSLKAFFSSKMNEAIKEEMNYSTFIDKFEIVCKAYNDTSLSLGFSQYANGEVVHLLNEETMHEREGALLLARIYNIAPSNIQVKQNLEGVLKALARITVEDGLSADTTALNKALQITGNTFKKAVDVTLIVQKVNNDKMSHKDALSKMYNLYLQDKNDEEICNNLASLCDICIWRYIIGNTYDSSSVESKLNAIYNNRSSTFINNSSNFASSFFKIMQQLPDSSRTTILIGFDLNSKGIALRKGLKYFVKFSPDGDIPSELTTLLR